MLNTNDKNYDNKGQYLFLKTINHTRFNNWGLRPVTGEH